VAPRSASHRSLVSKERLRLTLVSAIRSELESEQAEEARGICPRCGQRLPRPVRPGPRSLRIIQAVAFEFDLEVSDIMGRDRHKRIARARGVVCYLLRARLQHSYPEIGETMALDNTTVLNACRSVERWLREDPRAPERMSAIAGILERVLNGDAHMGGK
jgi:hypothetical protein